MMPLTLKNDAKVHLQFPVRWGVGSSDCSLVSSMRSFPFFWHTLIFWIERLRALSLQMKKAIVREGLKILLDRAAISLVSPIFPFGKETVGDFFAKFLIDVGQSLTFQLGL